ncbi:MAG TPA: hypothetical protein VK447_00580, partial [Myxococcaceae bacterium]|nr:hypothetical protein [Myxococcaceae bacterium]
MTSALLQALLGPEGPPTLWIKAGTVKDASDAARRLFGPALVPGVPALQLFDEGSRGKLEAALTQSAARTLEVHVSAPGDPPEPVRLLVVPAGDEAVVMCLGGVRELSGGLYDHLRALMSANDELTNLTRELSVRTREL